MTIEKGTELTELELNALGEIAKNAMRGRLTISDGWTSGLAVGAGGRNLGY
jgi:hypothetical protein